MFRFTLTFFSEFSSLFLLPVLILAVVVQLLPVAVFGSPTHRRFFFPLPHVTFDSAPGLGDYSSNIYQPTCSESNGSPYHFGNLNPLCSFKLYWPVSPCLNSVATTTNVAPASTPNHSSARTLLFVDSHAQPLRRSFLHSRPPCPISLPFLLSYLTFRMPASPSAYSISFHLEYLSVSDTDRLGSLHRHGANSDHPTTVEVTVGEL